jgi:hypothetical protein
MDMLLEPKASVLGALTNLALNELGNEGVEKEVPILGFTETNKRIRWIRTGGRRGPWCR